MPFALCINYFRYHPSVDTAYADGDGISSKHPDVHAFLQAHLPNTESFKARGRSHPNVNDLLKNPSAHPLPAWHLPLSDLNLPQSKPTLKINVTAYHPDVDVSYLNGVAVSGNHPSVQEFLGDFLPATHPDADAILRDPVSDNSVTLVPYVNVLERIVMVLTH